VAAAAGDPRALARSARATLRVDLAAIRHNLGVLGRLAGGAKVMAVVKGDAYGVGARVVAGLLDSCGAHAFAVDNVAEGIDLRDAGIAKPILVIDGDVPDNAPLAVEHRLTPGVAEEELLRAYDLAAASHGVRLPVWLVANVGFNRSGYRDRGRFVRFVTRARDCRHLRVQAVYAHLTNSNADAAVSRAQAEEFQALARLARAVLGDDLQTSLFASHGLVRWARAVPTDWVRPGILLYGEHHFVREALDEAELAAAAAFRPALTLRARLVHLLDFPRPEAVGYGQRHTTHAGQLLATVALGFGSGYPRGSGLTALLHGRRVRLFGDVGMDALQIDVTGVPARRGDWVTFLGADGGASLSLSDLARAAQLNPYQLLAQLRCHHWYTDPEDTPS
jgi:alanine racemase